MGIPIPAHKQFSDEEKAVVVQMFSNGCTHEEIGNKLGKPRRTIMKLCKHLKLKRSIKEAALLKNKSDLDKPEIIEKIKELRNTHSLKQIVNIVGGSVSAVNRMCEKYDIKINGKEYKKLQSNRMAKAWTPDKREKMQGSVYPQLNNKENLVELYCTQKLSMADVAKKINVPLSALCHHLKRHGIPLRTKSEYLAKLRYKSGSVIMSTKWGEFKLQSKSECDFVEYASSVATTLEHEPCTLIYNGSHYTPDFKMDGDYIEIKPPEYSKEPGVDRQRFMKQFIIADKNNISIKCWYKGKFHDFKPIEDIDKYFCLNWKIIFKSPDECFEFLCNFGFKPLEWFKDKLLIGINNAIDVNYNNWFNANYRNESVLALIKHFNPHYWYSYHKKYNCIADAFGLGNRSVLEKSVNELWQNKNNINIYELTKIIGKNYKDFSVVSIFKPWVARGVYNKHLPGGGTIIDPCAGWGGRMLGCIDSKYKYIGYDLNANVIECHSNLRRFVGSRISEEPEFHQADSSTIDFPDGDLLFTSPPYDDCEHYHGIDSSKTKTQPIIENIMKFKGIVALNVPKRQEEMCIQVASKFGRKLRDRHEMKTSSFMGREKTYEPILVFEKI